MGIVPGGVAAWARRRGLPVYSGHQSAVFRFDQAVRAAFATDVQLLTLFAFPKQAGLNPEARSEVLSLYGKFLTSQARRVDPGAPKVQVFGRRDRFPTSVLRAVMKAESIPRAYGAPLLRIGLDYDAREAVEEARAILDTAGVGCTFAEAMALAVHEPEPVPPTDVVIVTGGEGNTERVLYWEPLYATVCCLDVLWPDIDCSVLTDLIEEARRRPARTFEPAERHRRVSPATRIRLRP